MQRTIMLMMALMMVPACGPKKVVRDASAFRLETMAALARQQEAATALHDAAAQARVRGDRPTCVKYAEPALLIDAAAEAQAYRALWLAELAYPDSSGEFPSDGEDQSDPGAPNPIADVSTVCGDE